LNLIDTNIFVEVLLGRGRANECKELLERISTGELSCAVTHFSVHSVEAILGRHRLDAAPFLRSVEQSAGLILHDTTISDELAASMLTRQVEMDFDDTLQYFVAKKLGAESIVSFDRDFDGLDIPRREPKDFHRKPRRTPP
jgi:predicted nucleic acid-binding protein